MQLTDNKFKKIFFIISIIGIFSINNFSTLYEFFTFQESSYERVVKNIDLDPDSTKNLKYVDSSCETTQLEFWQNKQKISKITDIEISISYFNEITGIPNCHNRIIKSNANNKIISPKDNIFTVGIGIFEDFENLKRAISFNLIFFVFGIFYKEKKKSYEKIEYLNNFAFINIAILTYSIIYSMLTTRSVSYFFTSIFIPLLFQTNIFNLLYNYFSKETVIKTILTISFLPLLFFHSALSFYTSIGLVFLVNNFKNLDVLKKTLIYSFPLIISLVVNIKNFYFDVPTGYDYSILFQAGFFQNTIVNQGDGYKAILLNINIIFLIYIFLILKNYMNEESLNFAALVKSPVVGFLVWSVINLFINYSESFKFFIINFLGLSKIVDTEYKFMWSGFNVGYEMTSFWFLIILLCVSYLLIKNNNYYYLIPFLLLIFFSNLNGSRTAFLLFLLFFPILGVSIKGKKVMPYLVISLGVFLAFNIIYPQTLDRVVTKTFNSDCEISLEKFIQESEERTEKSFELSKKNQSFKEILKETTTIGKPIVNVINQVSCILSRQVEWMRFLLISDMQPENYLFGKSYGQSYEILVEDMQKPHSLFLTIYYMLGIFGVSYYIYVLIYVILKQFKDYKNSNYLQLLLLTAIVLNALKTDFIFTYWGTIFTFSIFAISSVQIKKI